MSAQGTGADVVPGAIPAGAEPVTDVRTGAGAGASAGPSTFHLGSRAARFADGEVVAAVNYGGSGPRVVIGRVDCGTQQVVVLGYEHFPLSVPVTVGLTTLSEKCGHKPSYLGVAVAAVVTEYRSSPGINGTEALDGNALAWSLGYNVVVVVNDFHAVGRTVAAGFQPDDLVILKQGRTSPRGAKAVFGMGSGCGVAQVPYTPDLELGKHISLPSEGSHVNLGISGNKLQRDLLEYLFKKRGGEHVNYDHLLSGPGLLTIFRFFIETQGHALEHGYEWLMEDAQDTVAQTAKHALITQSALNGSNAACVDTLHLFMELAGIFAGNLHLTFNANGGIYIAGGIIRKLLEGPNFLREFGPSFVHGFCNKGFDRPHLEEGVPVYMIRYPYTELSGALLCLADSL